MEGSGMGRGSGAWTAALAALWLLAPAAALAAEPEFTPTGQFITPDAAPGSIFQPLNPHRPEDPAYTVGQASAVALSPDGRILAILTSGFNLMYSADGKPVPGLSTEFLFLYDVSGPRPVQRQAIPIANTFLGVAWSPSGDRIYVSGGVDDVVHEYLRGDAGFAAARSFALGHAAGVGLAVKPEAGALAVSPDGKRLLVANFQNDSVSLIDLAAGAVREQDLRPGVIDPAKAGTPGGSFPRAVIWTSDSRAYVASERDRELIALDISAEAITVRDRIKTVGQPVALAADRGRLYAALDNSDDIALVDTSADRIVQTFQAELTPDMAAQIADLGGAGTNGLALSRDGRRLYVTNGGANDLAVVALGKSGMAQHVVGLIPTGWYPTAVAVRPDGGQLYVVNGKSNTGPVPDACRVNLGIDPHHDDLCRGTNQYVWQREKAGFLTLPPPSPDALRQSPSPARRRRPWRNIAAASVSNARSLRFLRALRFRYAAIGPAACRIPGCSMPPRRRFA